jgi:hypothetical protein
LLRRSGRKGTGFGQIPDEYLYETLGLVRSNEGVAAASPSGESSGRSTLDRLQNKL